MSTLTAAWASAFPAAAVVLGLTRRAPVGFACAALALLVLLGVTPRAGAQLPDTYCCLANGDCVLKPNFPGTCPASTVTEVSSCSSCPPVIGFCCPPSGSCTPTVTTSCAAGSTFSTTCPDCPSPVGFCCRSATDCFPVFISARCPGGQVVSSCGQCGGACCSFVGACTLTTQPNCSPASGNVWQGGGTTCSPSPCPTPPVRCCAPDLSCMMVASAAECAAPGQVLEGPACLPNPCPSLAVACCFANGTCTVTTSNACFGAGGALLSPLSGVTCQPQTPVCADLFGACCASNGACTFGPRASCLSLNGLIDLGAGSTCAACTALQGACCSSAGCTILTDFGCALQAGSVFAGLGTTCAAGPCASIFGACCDAAGACTLTEPLDCDGGRAFLGVGVACGPNDVCGLGRCCLTATGACVLANRLACPAPNQYTPQTLCGVLFNPCPQPTGACCDPATAACALTLETACAAPGVFRGGGSACQPSPCPPVNDDCAGAVMLTSTPFFVFGTTFNAATTGQTTFDCQQFGTADVFYTFVPPVSGLYRLSLCQTQTVWDASLSVHSACPPSGGNLLVCGVDCDPAPSFFDLRTIPSVALEAGTAYTIRVASAGTFTLSFGDFRLDGDLLFGACCLGQSLCIETSSAVCLTQWSGTFQGGDTVCTPSPCPPQCPPDFNRDGFLTIDDLFLYINAYFTGLPAADFNGVNGVTIDDLFLYINAYFVGC